MLISILFLQGIYICSCKQIMGQFVFHLIYLCICSGLSVALLFSSRPQWLTVVHTWEFTYVIYIIKNSTSFNSLLIPKFLSAAIAWLWWLRDKKKLCPCFPFSNISNMFSNSHMTLYWFRLCSVDIWYPNGAKTTC